MRVARSFAPADVRIEEDPDPEPGPGEVVCEVIACGVCASDVTDWYVGPRLPAVLGHELVGTISAVGPGASAPLTRLLTRRDVSVARTGPNNTTDLIV